MQRMERDTSENAPLIEKDHSCIFCAIIEGRVPASRIAENENASAFISLEGNPLVVPRSHVDLAAVEAGEKEAIKAIGQAASFAAELLPVALNVYNGSGVNLVANFGYDAGQRVDHVHFHLIPRKKGDRKVRFKDEHASLSEREKLAVAMREQLLFQKQPPLANSIVLS